MKTMELTEGIIEHYYGRIVDKAPILLTRYDQGKGIIPSETDIRLLGIRNFENAPNLANNYLDTSTLSATKGKTVKVIFPYETDLKTLTESARFGLGLIKPDEPLVNGGINLDTEGRWEKLEGKGVYTLQREGLILNEDLTEDEAMKHELLLIKLGHPNYVNGEFARSEDEVAEIIGRTFELGKSEHGYDTMMGQYLDDVSDEGVLKVWFVDRLVDRAGSIAEGNLDYDGGRFAFFRVGDAN